MVGLTGFEPVTPRLSSVCSNQLSYKPYRKVTLLIIVTQNGGAEEIRTPDILLAKQTLYQLLQPHQKAWPWLLFSGSYIPFLKAELCDQQLPHSVETEFDLAMVYSTMPTP